MVCTGSPHTYGCFKVDPHLNDSLPVCIYQNIVYGKFIIIYCKRLCKGYIVDRNSRCFKKHLDHKVTTKTNKKVSVPE